MPIGLTLRSLAMFNESLAIGRDVRPAPVAAATQNLVEAGKQKLGTSLAVLVRNGDDCFPSRSS
jgi:cell wall-associated NlpC family hydrolase